MAFSKLTRILLYAIGGISLLVILFFYASPNTVNMDELNMRVEQLMNPVDLDMPAALPAVDSSETDSTAVAETGSADNQDESEIFSTTKIQDTSGINLREHMSGWEYLVYFRTDIVLVWAYILLLISAISAIVFPLIHIVTNTKALIRFAGVLVAAAVIIIISYVLASDAPINIIGYTGESNKDPFTLKMVDTTLFVTYILFALAILSILYSIVSRVFK